MGARLGTLLLLALSAAGCALGPLIPRAQLTGWHAVESGGVRVYGDVTADELREIAGDLAHFEAAFALLAGWPAPADTGPVSVFLLRDRELARRFGLTARGVAGYLLPTLEGPFVTVWVRPSRAQTRSTLLHEYTHVLLHWNRRAPVPRWYDEGLASYFSTLYRREGAVVVGAAPTGWLHRVVAQGPMPLDRLFRGSLQELRGRRIYDFYATSWAVAHYLLSSPTGRRELSRFAKDLARGVPAHEAQQAAFGRSTGQLEREIAAHVGHLARGVPGEAVIDASDLRVLETPSPIALPAGDAAYALGYLALQQIGPMGLRSPRALAHRLFEMALDEDGANARAGAALAEVRSAGGDAGRASASVRAALARRPDDVRVRLHAGRIALARARSLSDESPEAETALAEAVRQFRAALALDPGSAPAWFGLGGARRRGGRSDEALLAFESARRFGWSGALDLELAELYLESDRREEALALLWPLAQAIHRGAESEAAAALLERAGLHPDGPGEPVPSEGQGTSGAGAPAGAPPGGSS